MDTEEFVVGDLPALPASPVSQQGGGDGRRESFLKHMINFDDSTRSEIFNISQYGVLGVVPVVCLLKLVKHYFPDANEDKSTFEITFETIIELVFILLSVFYIHRLICYFPTYSGKAYAKADLTQSALFFLVLLLTMQTKLGTKVNIVFSRLTNTMEGYSNYAPSASAPTGPPTVMNMMPELSMSAPEPPPTARMPGIIPSSKPGGISDREVPDTGGDMSPGSYAGGDSLMPFSSGGLSGSAY